MIFKNPEIIMIIGASLWIIGAIFGSNKKDSKKDSVKNSKKKSNNKK